MLPAAAVSIRLRVAVLPPSAEADERARDDVWPSDSGAESTRAEQNRTNWFEQRPKDFIRWIHSTYTSFTVKVGGQPSVPIGY